jgi:FtsP/CotA-like multicopper oxidase with cupredoxin domain
MFTAFHFLDQFLAMFQFLVYALGAWGVGRLAPRRTPRGVRAVAWLTLVSLVLAGLLLVGRLAIVGGMFDGYGWLLVADRVVVALPLLVVPGLATFVYSFPRLWRLRRADGPMSELAAPSLVVPVRVATVATAVELLVSLFAAPAAPYLDTLAVAWGGVAVLGWALWRWQWARYRRFGQPARGFKPHPIGASLRVVTVLVACVLAFTGWLAYAAQASALPERVGLMGHAHRDLGGGAPAEHAHGGSTGVVALTGPSSGEPDRRFTLTAQQASVRLSSGAMVEAWTFDGQLPGPELRVRQGDLVEVTLVNHDIAAGVTLHWHGVDVPNAEDGVAGVTQDAVLPGQTHSYRFLAEQVGSFWYHSHQQSAEQVRRGLFGAFIIEPAAPSPGDVRDLALLVHTWASSGGRMDAFGAADTLRREAVAPGTPVRLRLINADNQTRTFALAGVPFRVAAIDGNDLNAPTDLVATRLRLGGGGRYDLIFTMPDAPVHLGRIGEAEGAGSGGGPGLLLSPDGAGEPPALAAGAVFDPASYGSPAPTPFGATSRFDREFSLLIDDRLGFYNGKFSYVWTINGALFPDTPTLVVKEGELVKVTIANRSFGDHPMHLHGHHVLVLSRNGEPVSGSPWWTDTLNVAGGEWYEIALRADNPGVWMDHCHNLDHAAYGMIMHLQYAGVTTPYEVGPATPNQPE